MSGTYKTIQGDMWDAIAWKTMGSSDYTDALVRRNRAYTSCFTFPAGIVLEIPETEAEKSGSLPPWKQGVG